MRGAQSLAERLDSSQIEQPSSQLAQAVVPPATEPANAPPEATDLCIVTAEDATLSFSVAAKDADGDPLTVTATQPQSGQVEVGPEGMLTLIAGEPGLQSFDYTVQDGRGGSASADAKVFVNPTQDGLIPPVMSQVAPADLPALARACAAGIALDTTTLRGSEIQIQDPTPGQRFHIVAEPGQQIELQSRDFVEATYLVVDGGLLIITPDGNMAFVADFVRVAEGDDPLTLSLYEGPAVPANELLENLQPITETSLAGTGVGQLPPPAAGPEHGGGAGFSPYDPGGIGNGPDAIGPLGYTALAFAPPPFAPETQVAGANDDSPGPIVTIGPGGSVPVGEVTVSPEFTSALTFPTLVELQPLDPSRINGVDQGNLVLGPAANASIVFASEVAAFENSLGVYRIADDGTISDPKMVFARVDQAAPGDTVTLSDLYSDLSAGEKIGLFLIADGWGLNGDLVNQDLVFLSNGVPATIDDPTPQLFADVNGTLVPIEGNIFHTANPDEALINPLNNGGETQTASGLQSNFSGLTVGFEDQVLADGDRDFNDTVVLVDLAPELTLNFGYVPPISPTLTIEDAGTGTLSSARVAVVEGSGSDTLQITASLSGTGVSAAQDGSNGVVRLVGDAPIAVYESILRSIELQAAGDVGERKISIEVTDNNGATSEPVFVSFDYTLSSLIEGTNGPDNLVGDVNGTPQQNPIAGLGADDQLSGLDLRDLLDGGEGNDTLQGGPGDDLLFGGPGIDEVSGDEGADRFFILSLPDRGDQFPDFDATEGDVLDLTALFDGRADGGDINDFLQFDQNGSDIDVSADLDGPAPAFDFFQIATLVDPTGVTTVQEAVDSGAVAV